MVKDGEWFVPVVRGIEFADAHEAEASCVADNRLVELGGWNEQGLAAILADHAASDRGLTAIGFDQDDLDAMLRRISASTVVVQDEVPKICLKAMERAERRDLIDYGVSLRSG